MQQPAYLFRDTCKRLQTAGGTSIDYYLLPLLRRKGQGWMIKERPGVFIHSIPHKKVSVQTQWAVQRYLCTAYLPDACNCKPMKRKEFSEFWCAENRAEVIRCMIAGIYASFEPSSANC